MRVLVTGHEGYIGSVLVPFLQAAGHDVVGLDVGLFGGCDFGPQPTQPPALSVDTRDVRPEDLGLSDATLDRLSISWTRDRSLHVIFYKEKVVAVLTTQRRDPSCRGISVGSNSSQVQNLYDDQRPQLEDVDLPEGGHAEVRRYPVLGIGFETRAGKVVGMAVFPPAP